ncbi:hypothetical protein BMF94_2202 [Rhodotorula taiwanensis]|uniref:Prokaryotic-type class I peptide chain release factors domain-containing protein n=1 Tax=Rhodotorula taiwanensis TaxID=741276 RepID=A0A2S5BD68_9BASI|nr:hypothetical protein BMF94_2202 [Rhodotorula taiwanensis]
MSLTASMSALRLISPSSPRVSVEPFQRCLCTPTGSRAALDRRGYPPRKRIRPLVRHYAAAPAEPASFHEHLVSTAEIVLAHAGMQSEEGYNAAAQEGVDSVQAAKRESEMEKVRQALRELEDGQELVLSLRDLAESEPDEDMRKLAQSDLPVAEDALRSLRTTLLEALAPAPPVSSLSALVELKSGVGGNEASLFAAELVRMYQRVAQRKGWKASVVEAVTVEGVGAGSSTGGVAGAYKEALLEVTGDGAFGYLRREAGVHRVQRVPATESQGRVHTSTVGIIVLPSESATGGGQIDDSDLFEAKDVKIETMRSRGAGGQHVNRTESAIRLTHLPTGISVSMQDSRSQHENRTKAYRVLRARLLDRKLQAEQDERRSVRLNQVKGTDRSEKIRTYNFPQGRLTDHRIPLTLSALEEAIEGGEVLDIINRELEEREDRERLDDVVEALMAELE